MNPVNKWFKRVFGFDEPRSFDEVRSMFSIESSKCGGDVVLQTIPQDGSLPLRFFVGKFETPSVAELRILAQQSRPAYPGCRTTAALTFRHIVGDVGALHRDNAGAVFQAASQFNCLEMPGPEVTPDAGITNYVYDRTQGPTCALACPAATVYRNYFVNGSGQGGSLGRQLDLLYDVGVTLGNTIEDGNATPSSGRYWKMQNGYALPVTVTSISELKQRMDHEEVDVVAARDQLRVGVHWNTEVDASDCHTVTQVYCSAMPVGYHDTPLGHWSLLAQMVLDGTYEATLAVAADLAHQRGERVTVYLTKIGGGVFANHPEWIIRAIDRAIRLYEDEPIEVNLVHFGEIEDIYQQRLTKIVSRQGV